MRELRARIALDNTGALSAIKEVQNQARVQMKAAGTGLTSALGKYGGGAGGMELAKFRLKELRAQMAPLEAIRQRMRDLSIGPGKDKPVGVKQNWAVELSQARKAYESVLPALEKLRAEHERITKAVFGYVNASRAAAAADKQALAAGLVRKDAGLPLRKGAVDALMGIGAKNPALAQMAKFYAQQEKESAASGARAGALWGQRFAASLPQAMPRMQGAARAAYEQFWQKAVPPVIQPRGLAGMRLKLREMFSQMKPADVAGGLPGLPGVLAGALRSPAMMATGIGLALYAAMRVARRLFAFMKQGISEVLQLARQLQNTFSQTGLNTRSALVIRQAAEMAELDPKAVEIWWSRFQANLTNIEKTSPRVTAALARLGISFVALRKMSPEEQFHQVAMRLAAIPNITDRAGIAMNLFNRQGAEMLRIFSNPRLMQVAIEQIGKAGEIMERNRDKMAFVQNAFTAGIGAKRRGFFVGVFDAVENSLVRIADVINKTDLTTFGQAFGAYLKPIASQLLTILKYAGNLVRGLETLGPVLKLLGTLFGYWQTLVFKPITLVLGAVNALVNAFKVLTEEAKKFVLNQWNNIPSGVWKLIDGFYALRALISDIRKHIALMFEQLKELAPDWMKKLIELLAKLKDIVLPPEPEPYDKNKNAGLGMLTSFFAPFSKGPGDAWSKVGAFSTAGGTNPIAAGLNFQRDIARNTAETARGVQQLIGIVGGRAQGSLSHLGFSGAAVFP